MSEQHPTVEVAFSPTYGMPHFIGSTEDGHLFELGDDGWRLTMLPDLRMGDGPVPHDIEDALWRAAAALTGTPDLEAVKAPVIPGGALDQEADRGE